MTSYAADIDLVIEQGSDFDNTWTFYTGDTTASDPYVFTGATAVMKVRKDYETPSSVLSLSTTLDATGNGIVLGGAAGTIKIIIKGVTSDDIELLKGVYTLTVVFSTGARERMMHGRFVVSRAVR